MLNDLHQHVDNLFCYIRINLSHITWHMHNIIYMQKCLHRPCHVVVCVSVPGHRHTHTHTHRCRDQQTHTHRDRQTHTPTHTQITVKSHVT